MKLYAYEIADRLGLHRPIGDFAIERIVTDSRQAGENTLFAAIVGERSDGHDYIPELARKYKNIAFLVTRDIKCGKPTIVCGDILTALANIAELYLDKLSIRKCAVTGSVGKTSTKEMIACALSAQYKTQKSLANRNNELGMPLTAFSIEPEHEACVFEMGMRGFGQISYLARRVKPNVGVITNIGSSHIELLGSRENICKAKMELADCIAPGGVLLLNGDEPLLRAAAEEARVTTKFFGMERAADYFADTLVTETDRVSFKLHHEGKTYDVTVGEAGRHTAVNALTAIATATEMGVAIEKAIAQMAAFHDGGLRQHIYDENGITYFDDTYNASPESMNAALGVMSAYPNRKIAVLADMLELGEHSIEAHRLVGRYCTEHGVDKLIAYGTYAPQMAEGFDAPTKTVVCADRAEALAALAKVARQGDIILFKGSHAMQCDVLLQEFKKGWNTK